MPRNGCSMRQPRGGETGLLVRALRRGLLGTGFGVPRHPSCAWISLTNDVQTAIGGQPSE